MQSTTQRTPLRADIHDWSDRDKIAAASLLVVTILLVWSLILLYWQSASLAALQGSLSQQNIEIGNLQNQLSDDDRKHAADTTAIMNMISSHGSGNPQTGTGGTAPGKNDSSGNFNMMQPGSSTDQGTAGSGADDQ